MATEQVEAKTTEQEAKVKEKLFRLTGEDDARLPKVIELAHRLKLIQKQSFQDFMIFALNCAYTYVLNEYQRRRGKR